MKIIPAAYVLLLLIPFNSVLSLDLFSAVTYLGCYKDKDVRDFPHSHASGSKSTVEYCTKYCRERKYIFAGLQFAVECYCGNYYGKYKKSSETDCNKKCAGNANQICGGGHRNSVYSTGYDKSNDFNKVTYLGCYKDSSNRDLSYVKGVGNSASKEYCRKFCYDKKYLIFGMQNGDTCACGNSYGKYGKTSDSDCNKICKGNSKEFCGGTWRNTVFTTGYEKDKEEIISIIRCSQTTTYDSNTYCTNAIDGKYDDCKHTTSSITKNDANQAWIGYFGRKVLVNKVTIYGRTDKAKRLENFVIRTDSGKVCAKQGKGHVEKKTFTCKEETSSITIAAMSKEHIELCEVIVTGTPIATKLLPLTRCSQSSTFSINTKCENAINGKSSPCNERDVSITNKAVDQSWNGYFQEKVHVDVVKIWTRGTRRLTNFVIKTNTGKVCAQYNQQKSFDTKSFICDEDTTSITIQQGNNQYLEICEVEAWGSPIRKDIIPIVRCTQSSTFDSNTKCEKAIDGKKDICAHKQSSITKKTSKPSWTGYFETKMHVRNVKIYNRKDYDLSKENRVSNFVIKTDKGKVCAEYSSVRTFQSRSFMCDAETSSITIQLNGNNYLEMCEVEVRGTNLDHSEVKYLGCYKDAANRDFAHRNVHMGNKISKEYCRKYCYDKKYAIFGLQNGGECQCTNTYGKYGKAASDSECNKKCKGNLKEICGGGWRNSVYTTGFVKKHSDHTLLMTKCKQSSTFNGNTKCENAMNGHNKKTCKDTTSSITTHSSKPYWTGYFQSKLHVSSVKLYTRTDYDVFTLNRLSNFVIKADDGKMCAEYTNTRTFKSKLFKCNVETSSITIQLLGTNYLEICAVEVKGSGTDFAKATYLGCYKDAKDRDFSHQVKFTSGNKANSIYCQTYCYNKHYKYFGMQAGSECWCGNNFGKHGKASKDTECKDNCKGNSKEKCGGGWRNSVYTTGYEKDEDEDVGDQVRYLGCFLDKADRDLPHLHNGGSKTSIQYCKSYCSHKSYQYFGLQGNAWCLCGNSYGKHGQAPTDDCNSKCTGDSTQICGGSMKNSIYTTGKQLSEGSSVGCFNDDKSRDITGAHHNAGNKVSKAYCLDYCKRKNFPYFAMQESYCYCGYYFGRYGQVKYSDCNMKCAGNKKDNCGATLRNWVMTTGIQFT